MKPFSVPTRPRTRARNCKPAAMLALTMLLTACSTTAVRSGGDQLTFGDGAEDTALVDDYGVADEQTDAGNADEHTPGGDGLALEDPQQSGTDSMTTGVGASNSNGATARTDGTATNRQGGSVATGDTARMGPGITAREVKIGFEVSEGLTEAFGAVGYNNGGEVPKEDQIVNALVKWLNKRGGIRGRTVVPIIHKTNPTSGSFATQAQAACSTFTEDHQVFAAGSAPAAGSEVLASCMAAKKTPFMAHNYWPFGEQHFKQWAGYFYQPGRASGERHWANSIDALAAAGFFKNAKVGIVYFDAPHFRHLTQDVVKPRMARHGVKPAAEAAVSTIAQASDVSKVSAEANSIILRFRTEGVTHVLFVEYQGTVPFFFLPQAESQGYRPTYALVSSNNPSTVAKQSPPAQLEKIVGVGWNPGGDTLKSNYPSNATATQCETALREGGYAVNYSAVGFYLYAHCDTLMFLKAAIERADELTPAGLNAAVAGMGNTYLSPQTLSTTFGPNRFDGSASYRLFKFDAPCSCFAYTGPLQRFR